MHDMMNDNMPEPNEGHEDIHEICQDLGELIDSMKSEGKDTGMLEKAYKMLEKAHSPEDTSMASMPLDKARAKVKNAFKLPKLPKNEPMGASEEESPNSGY